MSNTSKTAYLEAKNFPLFSLIKQFVVRLSSSTLCRYIKIFFYALVVCYLSACAYLYIFQRDIIYLPTKERLFHPTVYGLYQVEEISIKTPDQVKLTAWYHKAKQNEKTILYFQGNNGNIRFRSDKIKAFMDKGFGVLALSYRGYGNSGGSPSEEGLYTDARTAIRYLKKAHHVPVNQMIFYGESLGSGVAVQMATEYHANAIILESPYMSLNAVARYRYPIIPTGLLLKDKFDSLSKIANVTSPVLIIHSYRDRVIPINHGKTLLSHATTFKEGLFLDGYSHIDIDYHIIADNLYTFSNRIHKHDVALLK